MNNPQKEERKEPQATGPKRGQGLMILLVVGSAFALYMLFQGFPNLDRVETAVFLEQLEKEN